MDITRLQVLAKECKRRCETHRITVQYVEGADTAYSTLGGVFLPALEMPITEDKITLLRYYNIHEVGHHIRRDAFTLLQRLRPNQNKHGCWNMIEDEVLERDAALKFYGDRLTIQEGRELFVNKWLPNIEAACKRGQLTSDSVKRLAVHVVCHMSRDWHEGIESLVHKILRVLPTQCTDLISELVSEGWVKRIGRHMSVKEVQELAYELHDRLWKGSEEEEEEEEGESGEGEGEGEGESQQSGEENGEENQEGTGEDKKKCNKIEVEWEDVIMSEHGKDDQRTKNTTPDSDLVIRYVPYEEAGAQYYADTQIKWQSGEWLDSEKPRAKATYTGDRSFANMIRRKLQASDRDEWEAGRKTGKLSVRAIKRLRTGTAEHNRRVFKRREDVPAMNTAVSLLVDSSGSMAGGRQEIAANAAAMLVDVIAHTIRLPVEVLAHSTSGGACQMYEIAKFGEHVDGEQVVERLNRCYMSGNADGDALKQTALRLGQRREQRKIMVVLCDGQPTDALVRREAPHVLRRAIREIRESGIELYCIGIQHPGVQFFYGNDTPVISDVSELPEVLFSMLSDKLINR